MDTNTQSSNTPLTIQEYIKKFRKREYTDRGLNAAMDELEYEGYLNGFQTKQQVQPLTEGTYFFLTQEQLEGYGESCYEDGVIGDDGISELPEPIQILGTTGDGRSSIELCLKTIRELCEGKNFSEEEFLHRARLLYLLNRFEFWNDLPILFDFITEEVKRKTTTHA